MIMKRFLTIAALVLAALGMSAQEVQTPPFPGAEGFGL